MKTNRFAFFVFYFGMGECFGVQALRLDFTLDGGPDRVLRHAEASARAEELRGLSHPRLARLAALRAPRGDGCLLLAWRLPFASSLRSRLAGGARLAESELRSVARGVFEALAVLSSRGVVHASLSPDTILLSPSSPFSPALSDWAQHYVTDGGRLLHPAQCVGALSYLAPEAFGPGGGSLKSAVWSAGVCLLEMLTGANPFSRPETLRAACRDADVVSGLLEGAELDRCSRELRELLVGCLQPALVDRYDAAAALRSPFCSALSPVPPFPRWEPSPFLPSSLFVAPSPEALFSPSSSSGHSRAPSADLLDGSHLLSSWRPGLDQDAFSFPAPPLPSPAPFDWPTIATSLLERARQLIPELPTAPSPSVLPGLLGEPMQWVWNPETAIIPRDEAVARIGLSSAVFVAVAGNEQQFELFSGPPQSVSLEVRENDVVYQQRRVSQLLPLLANRDVKAVRVEAAIDVPAVIRDEIWALLLGVPAWASCKSDWTAIDHAADGPADHQIAVDVPRCNARHELLGTPEGRKRLTRVLRAWVASNPGLEYWQGLDSLSAPFVAITWDSGGEERAFHMLQRMVRKYLSGMFLQKNTSMLQTQLIVFNQLLAYHDPQLFLHLHSEHFLPELFAIPWFLTLFTHILPIDATLRLWDFLFLHDATMIHFVSIAVMRQLRKRLLAIDFNEMVLFFSELHSKQGVDMARVVADAVKISRVTPNSLATDHFFGQEKPSLVALQENFSPKLFVADFVVLVKENKVAVLVFDVRTPEEWRAGHLEGSINIVPKDVDIKAVEQLRVKKPIVVVIAPEGREHELPNTLVKAGISRVTYLSGGMDALMAISDPTIKIVKG